MKCCIGALQDEVLSVRQRATSTLGYIKDPQAITPLADALMDWENGPEAARALTRLAWEPERSDDKVHYWVAVRDGDLLRKEWLITRKVLLDDVRGKEHGGVSRRFSKLWRFLTGDRRDTEQRYRRMRNALYAFVGIGKEEILSDLIKALHRRGDKTMAEAYLNCGHAKLSDAARKWASLHGYDIHDSGGKHQVTWGMW